MSDYEVGYGKPPKHSQFKKGVCPNPRGRKIKGRQHIGNIALDVLSARIEFQEKGLINRRSRLELAIRRHFTAALNGDIASAALLLKIRRHAEALGDAGPLIIEIVNSPDRQSGLRTRVNE
jgi:hypothetical protein